MRSTITSEIFYHIYPLGSCGAPAQNDFHSPPGNGLRKLIGALPRLQTMGITAVYIGPLFESTSHGYDTLDYYWVDRRLGTNEDLKAFTDAAHQAGIKVVLDAVLNHTGRHFFPFKDLQANGSSSPYRSWFKGIDFSSKSPLGDSFAYEGWSGHYDLAKLNTEETAVREHLFGAVKHWIERFNIDGLRLDAADVLSPDFMDSLAAFTRRIKPEFWLMGEVVHGDYRNWAQPTRLDSVTNYEMYKGLWSSFNDRNFFEIAWTLNRQYGSEGMYRHLALYNFADNHDVDRVATSLKVKSHLFPLYGLLFTVPGIPSIYYGSEWGLEGARTKTSDKALRPTLDLASADENGPGGRDLEKAISKFISVRKSLRALREGSYRQLHVASEQFAFIRELDRCDERDSNAIAAVNAANAPASITLQGIPDGQWFDVLEPGTAFTARGGNMAVPVNPSWLRILRKGL